MPYIQWSSRIQIEPNIPPLAASLTTEGDLNYAITRLVHEWIGSNPSYGSYNAAIGVLACAQAELYRTQVAPYEDRKVVANGPLPDVA